MASLTSETVKQAALAAGADLVGVGNIERYDRAPPQYHPSTILRDTRSIVALTLCQLRGTLKAVEDGTYWNAYNCDSYQFLNEIHAPTVLRAACRVIEQHGYNAVPIHNPFHAATGVPVRDGASAPDGMISLRVAGVVAGLGELGFSKMLLTPEYGPRQRVFAVLTDAPLEPDPLFTGRICDECKSCVGGCTAGAWSDERDVNLDIEGRVYAHATFRPDRCAPVHRGEDKRISPFLRGEDFDPDNQPGYYRFLQHRYRHQAICVGRGCLRACLDHLERAGRISKQYEAPLLEGEQWALG